MEGFLFILSHAEERRTQGFFGCWLLFGDWTAMATLRSTLSHSSPFFKAAIVKFENINTN